jgi:hypothetical protein
MECAAWPWRQGTVSCSRCIVEPKYPRAMSPLGGREFASRASAKSECWIAHAVAAVPPGMAAGMTDTVWIMEARLRYGVPRNFHARLDP